MGSLRSVRQHNCICERVSLLGMKIWLVQCERVCILYTVKLCVTKIFNETLKSVFKRFICIGVPSAKLIYLLKFLT